MLSIDSVTVVERSSGDRVSVPVIVGNIEMVCVSVRVSSCVGVSVSGIVSVTEGSGESVKECVCV